MATKRLYALLVGINEYDAGVLLETEQIDKKAKFPFLRGPVYDAEKVGAYLAQDDFFDSYIVYLKNEEATKNKIVQAFKEHLGKATEEDVAFFYFSGHGTQERADTTIWKEETDGKLEAIVCYYDLENRNEFLLADKELRYLIHQLSTNNPHIVTIFDCCHSADNTRNGKFVTTAYNKVVEKRLPVIFPKRDWSKFIFSDSITEETALSNINLTLIPEGLHIQLSACESDESAVEVAGEGVFTKTLLKVLKNCAGSITYFSLRSRIRQYLRNAYEQKPRVYVANGDDNLLFTSFLNKPLKETNVAFGEVTYIEGIGWLLNLGAIHGVGEKTKDIKIIYPENNSQSVKAKITSIGPDYSQITSEETLSNDKVYYAHIEGLLSQNLQVHLKNTNGLPEDQVALLENIFRAGNEYFVLEDNEEKAQYVVNNRNGKMYVTLPFDTFRPLALPVNTFDSQAPLVVTQQLQHISKWEYLKNFTNHNKNSTLPSDALRIEAFKQDSLGNFVAVETDNGKFKIDYRLMNNKWASSIKFKVTNTAKQNLFCCCLYLSSDFGASLSFLPTKVHLLEAGNSVELAYKEKNEIPVYLDSIIKWYNWTYQVEYIKFIVSTEEFDAQALSLEALPQPLIPKEKNRGGGQAKGMGEEVNLEEPDVHGWTTHLLTFVMKNPEWNKISDTNLQHMLNDPETADFALGLYFDASVNENRQETHILKPEVTIGNDHHRAIQKGIIRDIAIDLANAWARRQRNNHYKNTVRRFPDRLRIVAEGDSWFQHPLVLDIIDHLSRVYAIYCSGAAADTLRNYLSNKDPHGDYFLDAIKEHRPRIFLISGGGNDILGSQFREYLEENTSGEHAEGQYPERFIKKSFFLELDSLMDIYRSLFGLLKKEEPNLNIIVHGYDYPIKLNEANTGWLGRYMIDKGINREGDRHALMHLIMDAFNDTLKLVAEDFRDNVTYLDVRNIVRYDVADGVDQWYDEIHPNDDGFQQIAMKFMQVINNLPDD